MNKIKEALEKLFLKHRIISWYDDKAEMREIFEELIVKNVKKLKIENNEFGIKYQVMKQEPEQQFLIYSDQSKPLDEENWLLDLNLAFYEFSADRASMILQQLGLPYERKEFIVEHLDFFRSTRRADDLKELLESEDIPDQIVLKMIAVLANCDPELEKILYQLFVEFDQGKKSTYQDMEKYGLIPYFWKFIARKFNYRTETPTLKDLLIQLLQNCFYSNLKQPTWILNKEAAIFVNHWMDSAKYHQHFESLSDKIADQINLLKLLEEHDFHELLDCDAFRLVDKKIIYELKNKIVEDTIGYQEAADVIQKRTSKYWYSKFSHIYQALSFALTLKNLIKTVSLQIDSLEDGFENYVKSFYQFDYAYRKYIFHANNAEHIDLLKNLTELVENIYSNSFLLDLNRSWQQHIDLCETWKIAGIVSQRSFFDMLVKPFLVSDRKVFVIISDGLRYESGVELNELLLQENMYQSKIGSMFAQLPSYTQISMAALLPHKNISFQNKSSNIYVDQINSSGIPNRTKILQNSISESIAIQAKDFIEMNRDNGREFAKKYKVIYIFHNGIDAAGDNAKSESEVFDATEKEFEAIKKIIRQIINFNGSNVLITSDHGYIYQNRALEESDFCKVEKLGEINFSNRRFIVGKGLYEDACVKKFQANQLKIDGDEEILLAKSINRIRIQGGGNRYVHGGASLQEIVIPVIQFNKKRKSDTKKVNVDIIKSQSKITTNQIAIAFVQTDPVAEKVLPIELKIGFYSKDNKLLSDEIKLLFNSKSEDARNREQKHKFLFKGDANKYNNQSIYLKLMERIEGTNQFSDYKEDVYTLNISFTSEFDF
jgi:uncharacterized protein (TIGR02687 family)